MGKLVRLCIIEGSIFVCFLRKFTLVGPDVRHGRRSYLLVDTLYFIGEHSDGASYVAKTVLQHGLYRR